MLQVFGAEAAIEPKSGCDEKKIRSRLSKSLGSEDWQSKTNAVRQRKKSKNSRLPKRRVLCRRCSLVTTARFASWFHFLLRGFGLGVGTSLT